MIYNYNQRRHVELLKGLEDLNNQGINLFVANPQEDLELKRYNSIVQGYIFWSDRKKVGLLMEDFLNKKIDGEDLCGHVFGIHRNIIKECENFTFELLSNPEKIYELETDERSNAFCKFFTGLYSLL